MQWTNKGHQFDTWGKNFENKEILIYGAGFAGGIFLENMRNMGLDGTIKGFVDRNATNIGEYKGLPVYGIEKVFPKKSDKYIIVVAIIDCRIRDTVCDRLIRGGYVQNLDFFLSEKFNLHLNDVILPVYAMYAMDKLVLSSSCIIPSTICNLNCRDCLNFTPYMRQFETRTIDSLKADIDIFFHTIDYVAEYQISGGEPLLYGSLNELIIYIGSNYRKQIGRFEIVLNGTVIPKDDICKTAKKYELTMILDNYTNTIPTNLNHRAEIISQFESFDLLWIDNTVEDWFNLDIFGTDNTGMTEEQLQEYFDICNNPWHCYENAKFYACNFARFAEKAGISSEPESSYFSIRDLKHEQRKELLEFLLNYNEKGYVDLCKHCSGWADCNTKRIPVALQISRLEGIHR